MRFCILGSSSSGNCALLQTPQSRVLIDAGFSARRTKKLLAEFGQSIDGIDAVFLTHDHSDHSCGLKGLSRLPGLRVFANYGTSCAVQAQMPDAGIQWQIAESGSKFRFNDLSIQSFSVPHDAMDTVGYLFTAGDGSAENPFRSLAWMTDLGKIPESAARHAAQADVLVIEANHDIEMLKQSSRPYHLKQRILGAHGHLSNDATLAFLHGVENPRWKRVYLAHISPECNSTELVRRVFGDYLDSRQHCPISIVDPHEGCRDVSVFGPWERREQGCLF